MAAKTVKTTATGKCVKPSDADKVTAYMAALAHPLKTAIEGVRELLNSVDSRLQERIKWNARAIMSGQLTWLPLTRG